MFPFRRREWVAPENGEAKQMSTRSLIARQTENGFEAIYCHHDGYPNHHLPILNQYYATDALVAGLMRLGDLSSLGCELGQAHEFQTHNPASGWCLAYGRDRQEAHTATRFRVTEKGLIQDAQDCDAAYLYLFRNGQWIFRQAPFREPWCVALA